MVHRTRVTDGSAGKKAVVGKCVQFVKSVKKKKGFDKVDDVTVRTFQTSLSLSLCSPVNNISNLFLPSDSLPPSHQRWSNLYCIACAGSCEELHTVAVTAHQRLLSYVDQSKYE